jgi:hypothetical protein
VLAVALTCFALRALDTASIYNHTVDEPTQIASGLELLQYGTFELHLDVPPLAKVMLAAPLYIAGVRLAQPPHRGSVEDANALLYERADYWSALRAARAVSTAIGLLLLVSIYAFAMQAFGAAGAMAAVAVASVSPGLVSAGSIANSDILGVLTLLLALHLLRRLLGSPSPRSAAEFALSAALAVLAKLSALPFLAFSLPVVAAFDRGLEALEPFRHPVAFARAHWKELVVLAAVPPVVIWACYGFTLATALGPEQAAQLASSLSASHQWLAGLVLRLATLRLPLGGFLHGLAVASRIARDGHPAFLAGAFSLHGWPWYFPVTVVLKVPIGILAAVVLAILLAVRRSHDRAARELLLVGCVAVAILASVARAGVNAGHRHVVVLEALFALIAGGGVALALREAGLSRSIAGGALALALVSAAISSLRAHPDALGYFNAFAGATPDQFLVDSNIDWGQDLERLARHLRREHITEPIHLAYFGTAIPERHGLRAVPLLPNQYPAGWVACSVHFERGLAGSGIGRLPDEAHRTGYAWLLSLVPAAQIGTSIRLYHVTPTNLAKLGFRTTTP